MQLQALVPGLQTIGLDNEAISLPGTAPPPDSHGAAPQEVLHAGGRAGGTNGRSLDIAASSSSSAPREATVAAAATAGVPLHLSLSRSLPVKSHLVPTLLQALREGLRPQCEGWVLC